MAVKFRTIDKQGFFQFAASKLIVGIVLPFDVYMKQGGIFQIIFEYGTEFTALTKDFLIERGLDLLYVADEDRQGLETYLSKGFVESTSVRESEKAFKDYSFNKDKYYQIDRQMLIPGTSVHFSLYMMKDYNYSLVQQASAQDTAILDQQLLSAKGDLLILAADVPKYNEYIKSLLRSDKVQEKDTGKLKALLVRENAKIIVKDLFDNPRSGEAIKQTQGAVHEMIDSIMTNRDTIYDLMSIRGYDYYTYTHSVNVCVLAVGLGVAANLNRDETERLGIGAMLHDIGKSVVPVEIVNKQGKLDDMEYRIIQTHVAEGEKILKESHKLPHGSLFAVTQHHEKMNGRGYPSKLSKEDITIFGRITAIADCYDALTTTRPYRTSLTPFCALGIIAKETGNYDPVLLRLFITMLGKI
jgi:HD-GYP domain-containing protein (c-di-GMP phosphodiesterase class II)